MAIALPDLNAVFVHVPKAGGSWVRDAIIASGIRTVPAGGVGEHNLPDAYATRGRRFCFVRHPLTWYESAWRGLSQGWPLRREIAPLHRERSWSPIRFLTYLAGARDFNDFLNTILSEQPGFVSRMFEWFVGPPGYPRVEFVGRMESIESDLSVILKWFDWSGTLAQITAVNEAQQPRPEWDENLRRKVEASEVVGIRRWYTDAGPFRISVE